MESFVLALAADRRVGAPGLGYLARAAIERVASGVADEVIDVSGHRRPEEQPAAHAERLAQFRRDAALTGSAIAVSSLAEDAPFPSFAVCAAPEAQALSANLARIALAGNQGTLSCGASGDSRAVILLHGWPQTCDERLPIPTGLAEGRAGRACDVPGPRDGTDVDGDLTTASLAVEIHAAVAAAFGAPVHLSGRDFGVLVD